MKIFKLLFSKIFVSALALLFQTGVFIAVLLFFEVYIPVFQIFSAVFSVLVVVGIINKKESPEFKLPWLFIILVLPFFGLVVYCMFANSKMSTGQHKRMVAIACRCKRYAELTQNENKKIFEELGEYAGAENYLRRNSFTRGHRGNEAVYFPDGRAFYTDLLSELEKAEKFIFMEYFIIERGKMWDGILEILLRKVKEGVEVRVMYDDIGTAGLLKSNYHKKLSKEGIICRKFNPFRPVVSGIHNNRDHRKITVIDGKTAYTGGINLADEYINEVERFGHWKDVALRIRGSAVGNFTQMFLQMFDSAKGYEEDYGKYLGAEYEVYGGEGIVHPFGDGPKPFYTEQVGANNYLNIINSAKNYVYIATPYLIPDHTLISALRNAAMRGVDVKIITPHRPDKKIIFNMTRSNYKYLSEAGVNIYEYVPGFIHAKTAVADGKIAFVGTVNLDYRSLVHHYECGVTLFGTPCIKDIKTDFDETLALSQKITKDNFKMGFIASLINSVLNLFSPML